MNKNIYLFILLLSNTSIFANNFTSMQGYTGLINTPTPETIGYGIVDFSYSNQVSLNKRINKQNRFLYNTDDYFVNLGLLPFLEITGRLSETPNVMRDLSASFKLKLPTKKLHSKLPNLALGMQDFGGETGDYKAKYLVLGDTYKSFSYSVGYGYDSKRLNGLFYGLSYKYNDYLHILTENDSKENHLGIRLTTDNKFKNKEFSLLVKKNLSISKKDYSFLASMKIDLNKKNNKPLKQPFVLYDYNLYDLRERLKNIGLENIDICTNSKDIYIAYENQVFNQNELDAINAILKILVKYKSFKYFHITVKKENINIINLTGNLDKYRLYLKNPTKQYKKDFTNTLKIDYNFFNNKKCDIKNFNPSRYKLRLSLAPRLLTFVGTEYGTLDYFLGLETRFVMNLYKGVTFSSLYRSPVTYSDDFDPDTGAYKSSYETSRLQNLLLHYTFSHKNILNSTTLGKYYKDYYTLINESALFYKRHDIKLKVAKFVHKDDHSNKKYVNLITYEYNYPKYDLGYEIVYGKFFNQDKGYKVKFKKFFNNTLIYMYYAKSKPKYKTRFSEDVNKFVGIGFEIPLVPKKISNKYRYFQLTSTNFFNYGISTTVGRKDGTNTIVYGQLIEPKSYSDISRYFYNKNRLSLEYIKYNIE